MTRESDLKGIPSVCVDTICVDQTNYERRKTTIGQMSNIYESAIYILAVPDLHLQHLINGSAMMKTVIDYINQHSDYIYSLLQGDMDQLVQMDCDFLDAIQMPQDPALRQLLADYCSSFANAFTRKQKPL
ncbi:hypothetical protein BCR42DRAFT_398650 [Absidia repens]|uniref:Heterokaryon incompatibility domain-containing protein n=1 Tax=Absidia repens TaxID=90262 RepID=A0A1X2HXF9_9FUNG|nr:hypothetical protein BCR42DRAFT_398650 [Absidia repens]